MILFIAIPSYIMQKKKSINQNKVNIEIINSKKSIKILFQPKNPKRKQ